MYHGDPAGTIRLRHRAALHCYYTASFPKVMNNPGTELPVTQLRRPRVALVCLTLTLSLTLTLNLTLPLNPKPYTLTLILTLTTGY